MSVRDENANRLTISSTARLAHDPSFRVGYPELLWRAEILRYTPVVS